MGFLELTNFVYWVPLLFLLLLSILDIKTFHLEKGFIPSILTTIAILISFLFIQNPVMLTTSLIIGLLFFDLRLFDGEPDLKMIVACGSVCPNLLFLMIFALLISCFGVIYKLALRRSNIKEIPFLPVIMIAYIGMVLLI